MRIKLVCVLISIIVCSCLLLTWTEDNEGNDADKNIREEIMQADRDFDKAVSEKGLEGWLSFFAEDGKMFRGADVIQGKEAIRKHMAPAFETPGYSLRWQPDFAEVSSSGDLGYTYGSWVSERKDAEGTIIKNNGRYLTIWRKEADGSWKVVADIGTVAQPPKTLE
ncbi:MAG: hypothetical protein A2Y62_13185 [Candidatus Fischerbacteria bacterium RBG_13_37_8]|uniref:DUF4440 domain-containing protein n=1 Tax=Candidatus Fischerbacteria bacterium RBG_13_37_8 TaxID=1817863 RepID=A0A1F5VN91_9BACT|nr:MAG: hypothetical protein A2Y62_13185 [Candidatus Fischerbacteria bacterium RBG_13_37_8]